MNLRIQRFIKVIAVTTVVTAVSLASLTGCAIPGQPGGTDFDTGSNILESSEEPETEPTETPTPVPGQKFGFEVYNAKYDNGQGYIFNQE